jgi:hypothetical protein
LLAEDLKIYLVDMESERKQNIADTYQEKIKKSLALLIYKSSQ